MNKTSKTSSRCMCMTCMLENKIKKVKLGRKIKKKPFLKRYNSKKK